jgi:glycosyltransferase involved in cell wall biosynthesis
LRVLWVTPYAPDPKGGAGVAIEFELLRLASRHHEIAVIAADRPEGSHVLEVAPGRGVPLSGTSWRSRRAAYNRLSFAAQFLRAWPSHEQWLLGDRLRALRTSIRQHQQQHPVDLVHFTSSEMAPLVGECHAPAVLLAFDVFSRQAARERAIASTLDGRWRWRLEQWRLERWERTWLPRLDAVATVTDVDAAALRALMPVDATVIPTPVPDAYFAPPEVERTDRTVTLVANLDYRPNIDAVEWLTREIWPRVVDDIPDARLEVVGANPAAAVIDAVGSAGGTLFANVPDVRPYYWRAAAAVAPIRSGSGLRNKILHAMACGAPVVATSTALEGIDVQPERQLLVADDAESFARSVVSTLEHPTRARERAAAAADALAPFRSDAIGDEFEAWWAKAVAASA